MVNSEPYAASTVAVQALEVVLLLANATPCSCAAVQKQAAPLVASVSGVDAVAASGTATGRVAVPFGSVASVAKGWTPLGGCGVDFGGLAAA